MGLTLVTPAAAEPLDLDLIRAHLKVTDTAEDNLLQDYLQSAIGVLEQLLDRQFLTATWDYALDAFPAGDTVRLPRSPLQSVTSITYYDTASLAAPFAEANYQVDIANEPGRVVLAYGKSWPTTTLRTANGVVIRFVAGYGTTAASVPPAIRQALRLLVAQSWSERQPLAIGVSAQELPYGIWDYLSPYRLGFGVA